ncbi:hypothetical protein [Curtobacterium sp. MCSS17_016]|uniref:hypothetical protein n=1 Tax=Curtobacterium sp. MCSS17_016 TaxID=2175644 RepID=UPI000DA965CD|nr:hypothetical protein [Curtobacterium sp. MCSS17_016]WIE81414.1 hypothetical protein DEJ19_019455 [Curtobacterium sp. MCSS17_016]
MHPLRRRLVAALIPVIAGTIALTGCSSHEDAVPKNYGHQWMSQMSSQLSSEYGGGGGRLVLGDDNPKKATASIALQNNLEGPYDILAVCRSTETVHLTIHAFTATKDGSGQSLDTKERLGEADIDCGATMRIPIDVPRGRDGITLDASTTDTSERTLFEASIVTRGAKA